MMFKIVIAVFAFVAVANCGIVAPAAYVAPYASTYNAHTVNHAVAYPAIAPAAKIVASPYVAAASPYVAAASPYVAAPAFASARYVSPYSSAYSALPYSLPYSAYNYPASYYL